VGLFFKSFYIFYVFFSSLFPTFFIYLTVLYQLYQLTCSLDWIFWHRLTSHMLPNPLKFLSSVQFFQSLRHIVFHSCQFSTVKELLLPSWIIHSNVSEWHNCRIYVIWNGDIEGHSYNMLECCARENLRNRLFHTWHWQQLTFVWHKSGSLDCIISYSLENIYHNEVSYLWLK